MLLCVFVGLAEDGPGSGGPFVHLVGGLPMTNSFTVQRERPSNRMSETAVVILVLRQIDFSGNWSMFT